MNASVKQSLAILLKAIEGSGNLPFQEWVSLHGKPRSRTWDSDLAVTLSKAYGGVSTLIALKTVGLERLYLLDLEAVVGKRRARAAAKRIDPVSKAVRGRPMMKATQVLIPLIIVAVMIFRMADNSSDTGQADADLSSSTPYASQTGDSTNIERPNDELASRPIATIPSRQRDMRPRTFETCMESAQNYLGRSLDGIGQAAQNGQDYQKTEIETQGAENANQEITEACQTYCAGADGVCHFPPMEN